MRWVVEIPDPSGGTAATVTVEARSWLEGLTKARGGVALAKYHAEIDDDGLVRVLDRNTRDRFTVRPMKSIGPDAARPMSPAPEAPLLFSSPPPADPVFAASDAARPAPTAPTAPSPSSPPGEKSTLISHRAVYALGGSEPPLTGAHAAARGGRGGRRSPSSSETPRVSIPAPQPGGRKSPPPAATDSAPPGERNSQPRIDAPPSAVVAFALDYANQHEGRERAPHAEAPPARPEVPPPAAEPAPTPEPDPSPAPAAASSAPTEDAAPARGALDTAVDAPPRAEASAASALVNGVPDNNRSDTLVVPTVTAHDGIVEPLPVPTVLFERDDEPGPGRPIAYRERVFAVPSGTTRERAEALARQSFAAIKRALASRPRGRFVTIAVFDEEFTTRPSHPPLVVLEWKDWRGDPTVSYPDSLPPPEPEAPPAPPPPAAPEAPKRARVPTESDISMVEVVPPAVPMAAIPSASDISMVEVLPPPPPTVAPAVPVTPAAAPPARVAQPTPGRGLEGKGKKDKKRRRTRTSSEPNLPTGAARQASLGAVPQTPAERDAPTMVVPIYQAPTAEASAPAPEAPAPVAAPVEAPPSAPAATASPAAAPAAGSTSAPSAPEPAATPAPAAEAAPAAAPTPVAEAARAAEPAATAPLSLAKEPEAPAAKEPEAPAAVSLAKEPDAPAAKEPEAPATVSLAKEPEAPAAKEPEASAAVSLAKEPEAPVAVSLAKEPEAPAKEPEAPVAVSLAKEPEAPAKEPEAPVAVSLTKEPEAPAKEPEAPRKEAPAAPARSSALTAKRRRGKELVGDLFDALMDLAFTQSPEDACSFAARVLHEYVVCDGCSVAVYDIDRDEFVVSASEGVSLVGDRDKASRGSRMLAVRKRSPVNARRGDATEGLADFLAGGPAVFVPAFHRERLFAMAVLQRMPGGPAFESDEEDGAAYVAGQLAEALATHSKRAGAKQLDEEIRKSVAPKKR